MSAAVSKNMKFKIIAWILAILAFLLLFEFASRQAVYNYYLWKSYKLTQHYYKVDGGFLDFKRRIDATRNGRLKQKDPFINDIYNRRYYHPDGTGHNWGFGQKAPQLKAKEGVTRILCIGSSTVEQGFPEPLQKVLDSLSPGRFEVINAGIPAASILNTYMNYNLNWRKLKPDIVILEHNVDDVALNAVMPYSIDNDTKGGRKHFLQASQEMFSGFGGGIRTLFMNIFDDESPFTVEKLEHPNPEGLQRFNDLLEAFVMAVRGSGAHPVLLTYQPALSDGDTRGDYSEEFYNDIVAFYQLMFYSFTVKGAVETVDAQNVITRNVARKNDVTLVDIAGNIPRQDMFFIDGTHHSEKAGFIVAKKLAARMLEDGIITAEDKRSQTGETL